VVRALDSRRYESLVDSWARLLEVGDTSDDIPAPNAERPIVTLASKRIRRMYERALREGAAISDDSPPDALHELRKTCKKLRYLLEFFQSLYPPKPMGVLIRSLKVLQDNLGEYQDLSVQIHSLQGFEEELRGEQTVGEATLRAIEVLVDLFEARQHEVRAEFSKRFQTFSESDTSDRLHKALRAGRRSLKGRT
jgi:CHAD domain-containing protein